MMTTIETYVRRGKTGMKKLAANETVREGARVGRYFFSGLLLSAASLGRSCQPIAMGLVCALSGWQAAVAAMGGAAGYLLFWGNTGIQGLVWLALALPVALLLGHRRILDDSPYLMMAIASLIVAASGLSFQLWAGDTTPVGVYLLRIAAGSLTAKLFEVVRGRRDPAADWMAQGIGVLCLTRIAPLGFSLGYVGAGMLAASGPIQAAALGGLALDLAMVCRTPMTAALCLACLVRVGPWGKGWVRCAAPCLMYLIMMTLGGNREFLPFWGLALGGLLGVTVPPGPALTYRRGETGMAQVRLEVMANCLAETQKLLLEQTPVPIDEEALLEKARERACGSCPNRKTCRERLEPFPTRMLHTPYTETGDLTVCCKKPGRLVQELRRAQEQLKLLRADRERQGEYRDAVVQQYQFLVNFLRQQLDLLPRRGERLRQRYQPEVSICSSGRERANGDRCVWFHGPGCRYFILLCDGMGTGTGAAQEGDSACTLLRQMLSAGFPAEYALRSLNSLTVLRGRAGAVTVDLAEIHLDSGRAVIYKWGAAPSYLICEGGAEKIGTAGPPPGLSVKDVRETAERLSLRRGEVLILVSDGVDGEAALRRMKRPDPMPPGELAAKVLELGARNGEDDATVAAVRLFPGSTST
jgi:hypothetical protein